MTPHDALLLWVSERREGSLLSLNEACRWTASRLGSAAWSPTRDDLVALGHVSIENGRWRVNAPCHVVLSDSGGNGIMVGARPAWLAETLQDLDASECAGLRDLADHTVENLVMPQEDGPSTWWLSFGPEAPTRALESLGVRSKRDLSGSALRALEASGLPQIRRTVRPGEVSARLVTEGFGAAGGLEWEPATHDREPGVYRYQRTNQRIFAVRDTDGWLECDERWATWLGLRRARGLLWCDISERLLHVSTAMRLPAELERVLVLRTGRLPTVGTSPDGRSDVRTYTNVTHSVATRVARLIKKELTDA